MIGIYLDATPWAAPLVLLAALVLAGVAGPLARRHGLPTWVVYAAGLSWATFVAVTATPSELPWVRTDRGLGDGAVWSLGTDTVSWPDLTRVNEPSLNVWLAVPLGATALLLALALRRWWPLLLAVATPLVAESLQMLVPQLGRVGFLLADVALNLAGVGLGVLAGLVLSPLLLVGRGRREDRVSRPPERRRAPRRDPARAGR